MGGRGTVSASGRGTSSVAARSEFEQGLIDQMAGELGVSEKRAAEMYDAVNRWADDSTGIKNAQRGGPHTEQDEKDTAMLNDFIEKAPSYNGEIIRVMSVPENATFRKGGRIKGDGSITSWTVPGNYFNAKNEFGATDKAGKKTVVLHVSATKGADTRRYSWLSSLDGEIFQSGGYDSSLRIKRVQTKTESNFYGEKEKVTHVYLAE